MNHVHGRGAATAREADAGSSVSDTPAHNASKAGRVKSAVTAVHEPTATSPGSAMNTVKPTSAGGGMGGVDRLSRGHEHIEPIFHPGLRRTKEVIRRPEWVRRTGEGVAHRGSLNTVALFGIMFANCVGGGYGFEDGIGAAGPLITLIVCAILPWLWAFPTGLAVAELSTAVPSNSGVLMWTNAAFPSFVSFMCIMATIFITFIGNATYPNLTAQYAQQLGNLTAGPVAAVKVGVVVLSCVLNCVGVEIVGNSSIVLCAITILPFMLLVVIQLFGHGFNRAVLACDVKSVDWAAFFSIISWNYANIENAGAVVEEVANPRKAFPKAMIMLMLSTYVAYVLPMLAGVSAMGETQDFAEWRAGHWPEVARKIAGDWLKYLLFCGALLSGVGFTLTSMCCTSRLLAGMGTMQMFPKKISRVIGYYHPRLGTPIPAVILNSVVTLVFSVSMDFESVVALCQSIYCLRMLLIYASVIKLRMQYPNLPRPYALPFSTKMTVLVLLPAAMFSLMASIVSAMSSLGIGIALVCFVVGGSGVSWVYCRIFARNGFQGVIVQCAVSSDDDDVRAEGAGADGAVEGAEDGTLSEGVFYHDGELSGADVTPGSGGGPHHRSGSGGGGDLLLGILPVPGAVMPASMASNRRSNPNLAGVPSHPAGTHGPEHAYLRRGVVDANAGAVDSGEEDLGQVEYTGRDVSESPALHSTTNNNASGGNVHNSPHGSLHTSLPAFGGSWSQGPKLRRRRTHSLGGSGGYGSAGGVGVSGEESAEDGDWSGEHNFASSVNQGGGSHSTSAAVTPPTHSTSPPLEQLLQGGGGGGGSGVYDRSRDATPTRGTRNPMPKTG